MKKKLRKFSIKVCGGVNDNFFKAFHKILLLPVD
jgi:hypothetical protein